MKKMSSYFVDSLQVTVYNTEETLANEAAAKAITYLKDILSHQPKVRVILATGQSQIMFLNAFTQAQGIDWKRVQFFHLDEYLGISAASSASFRYYLREKVENVLKVGQFFYIQGDTAEPLSECQRYSQLLQEAPLDLCFLGVGENGHLAFNEPKLANINDEYWVKLVKLTPETRLAQVNAGEFPTVAQVPSYAFTLTLRAIFSARKLLCLAPKASKAEIVKQLLTQPINSTCPASFLRQHPQAELLLDQNSASLINR